MYVRGEGMLVVVMGRVGIARMSDGSGSSKRTSVMAVMIFLSVNGFECHEMET